MDKYSLADESRMLLNLAQESKQRSEKSDVKNTQENDPTIRRVLEFKKKYGSLPLTVKQKKPIAMQQLLYEYHKRRMKNGLLCRCEGKLKEVVWPKKLRHHVIK